MTDEKRPYTTTDAESPPSATSSPPPPDRVAFYSYRTTR
jgi:hypothetical protein